MMTSPLLLADIEDLAARFAACTIPREEWTHLAHLAVGTWHVYRYGPDEALARLRIGICRLNERHGTPNSATSGDHETVTRAYVQLLAELLAHCPSEMPMSARVATVIAGPLADKNVLLKFYSRERLMAPLSRAEWVEPDIAPLRLAELEPGDRDRVSASRVGVAHSPAGSRYARGRGNLVADYLLLPHTRGSNGRGHKGPAYIRKCSP